MASKRHAEPMAPAAPAGQRIDKWLFFARVVKSRSLAQKLVQAGGVRINGDKTDNAARTVRPGDTLRIVLDNQLSAQEPGPIGKYFWNKQAKNKTGVWTHDHDVYSRFQFFFFCGF